MHAVFSAEQAINVIPDSLNFGINIGFRKTTLSIPTPNWPYSPNPIFRNNSNKIKQERGINDEKIW